MQVYIENEHPHTSSSGNKSLSSSLRAFHFSISGGMSSSIYSCNKNHTLHITQLSNHPSTISTQLHTLQSSPPPPQLFSLVCSGGFQQSRPVFQWHHKASRDFLPDNDQMLWWGHARYLLDKGPILYRPLLPKWQMHCMLLPEPSYWSPEYVSITKQVKALILCFNNAVTYLRHQSLQILIMRLSHYPVSIPAQSPTSNWTN